LPDWDLFAILRRCLRFGDQRGFFFRGLGHQVMPALREEIRDGRGDENGDAGDRRPVLFGPEGASQWKSPPRRERPSIGQPLLDCNRDILLRIIILAGG
jgi:hypothetical protein